jgi:Ca2+-binding RTX toxin-like protein
MAVFQGTELGEPIIGTEFDDEIDGLGGDDFIDGGAGNDSILGGFGNDTILGGDGDDFIVDIYGQNLIFGGAGNDYIYNVRDQFAAPTSILSIAHGGAGDDVIIGGAAFGDEGNDTLYGSDGLDALDGGDGDDLIILANSLGQELDTVFGGAGTDTLVLSYGVSGNLAALQSAASIERVLSENLYDSIRASTEFLSSVNYISAPGLAITNAGTVTFGAGSTLALAGDGSIFQISIESAGVTLDLTGQLGTGPFYLTASEFGSTISGSEGLDYIFGSNGNDNLNGGAGDDQITGSLGNDVIGGGEGMDVYLVAGDRAEYTLSRNELGGFILTHIYTVNGDQGTDIISNVERIMFNGEAFDPASSTIGIIKTGTIGIDVLNGTVYDDTISGLAGNDTLLGGLGNDTLNGGKGNDTLNGGGGIDTASYVNATSSVTADLSIGGVQNTGTEGRDQLISIENLTGSAFNDILSGNGAANVLVGGRGNDTLSGKGGNDILAGGGGNDTLTGGAGSDTFLFDTTIGRGNFDTVKDFVAGTDLIGLSESIFSSAFAAGAVAAEAFHVGSRATTADHHLIYNAQNGTLYFDPDGVGGLDQIKIAEFTNKPMISVSDFVLFP